MVALFFVFAIPIADFFIKTKGNSVPNVLGYGMIMSPPHVSISFRYLSAFAPPYKIMRLLERGTKEKQAISHPKSGRKEEKKEEKSYTQGASFYDLLYITNLNKA